jgi:hypothetical protein
MGMWRASRYKFGHAYLREYHRIIPISAPEDDWDDRNALYAMLADYEVLLLFFCLNTDSGLCSRVNLLCSALYGSNQHYRQL